jgi:RNA polymerase sigma-70 factor (ECF subfamily)
MTSREVDSVIRRKLSRDDIRRLYDEHDRLLLAYGTALLGDVAAAEDLIHQVFVRLLRGDLVITGAPASYLCRAVRNAALNVRRGWWRQVELERVEPWLEAPPDLHDAALGLQQALGRLPCDQREVVVLHVWGQLTFQEIGEAVAISPSTAASRYRYGLARLREVLKPLRTD